MGSMGLANGQSDDNANKHILQELAQDYWQDQKKKKKKAEASSTIGRYCANKISQFCFLLNTQGNH